MTKKEALKKLEDAFGKCLDMNEKDCAYWQSSCGKWHIRVSRMKRMNEEMASIIKNVESGVKFYCQVRT